MARYPRNGRPYRRLVDELRAQHMPCWLCGHNIDYSLDPRHRMSFTLDHLVPISRGGSLLDPANARAAHRACNSSKGARAGFAAPQRASRRW